MSIAWVGDAVKVAVANKVVVDETSAKYSMARTIRGLYPSVGEIWL